MRPLIPVDPSVFDENLQTILEDPSQHDERLLDAVESLPDKYLEVIEGLWFERPMGRVRGPRPRPGTPVVQLARRLEVSATTVRAREREAFEMLKELLGDG